MLSLAVKHYSKHYRLCWTLLEDQSINQRKADDEIIRNVLPEVKHNISQELNWLDTHFLISKNVQVYRKKKNQYTTIMAHKGSCQWFSRPIHQNTKIKKKPILK